VPVDERDVSAVKQRLAPRLLGLEGVTGVGARGGRLTVYLDGPRDETRRRVAAIVAAEAQGTVVEFFEGGTFRRLT
jgi:hypothetical protein